MALLPCGIHFDSYSKEKAYIHTRVQWVCFLAFLIFLLFLPQILSVRFIAMVNIMAIMCIAVVGLQITTGYAGQINLGQSAFMGMGAYVCATLVYNWHLPFWVTIPAGGLGGAMLGAVFGIPALRIKGFYLGLTTIAAQVMFPLLIMHMPLSWFGGGQGLRIEAPRLWDITLNTDQSIYYLIMGVACIMILFAFNLVRGRVGRAFVSIRDNEITAELMGINVFSFKTLAFFIGAMYAGVAGGLWAYYIRYVGADQFTLYYSVWFVGMLIVGGLGNILGAILGTIFIRSLQETVTYLGPFLAKVVPQLGGANVWFAGMNIFLGGIIILFLIFEPRGIYHRWCILKTNFRIWPFPYV